MKRLLAAPLLLAPTLARADDAQAWLTARITVKVSPRLTLSNETIARTGGPRGFYDLTDNVQATRRLGKRLSATLGYTHQSILLHGKLQTNEHRLRQQLAIEDIARLGPLRLGGRLRLEERWRENQPGTAVRLRPQARVLLPLGHGRALALAGEGFLDLDRTGFQRVGGFERLRTSLTFSTPVAKHLTAEIGYSEQHGEVFGGGNTDDHIATLGLTAAF